jgi:hypothetical protein
MPDEAVETLMELHARNDPLLATLEIERIERKRPTIKGTKTGFYSGRKQWAWGAVAVMVPIVVAAIGAYTTLGAAQVGHQSGVATTIAGLQPTINAALTQQAAPTDAPQVIEVTSPPVTVLVTSPPVTVIVTSPPIVVTNPPEVVTATPPPPAPTPETTLPGTVLDVGQTWRQGGAELTLKNIELHGVDGVWLNMELTNRKSTDISIRFSGMENFSAVDNNNRKHDVCFRFGGCERYGTYVIAPADKIEIRLEGVPAILVNTGEPTITEILLKVVNISTITEAQWRIPIAH